jgi:hypothetical protein
VKYEVKGWSTVDVSLLRFCNGHVDVVEFQSMRMYNGGATQRCPERHLKGSPEVAESGASNDNNPKLT